MKKHFCFAGCGGNVNNYENIQQCVSIAMEGACCYRTFNISKDAVVKNQQQMQILCKVSESYYILALLHLL